MTTIKAVRLPSGELGNDPSDYRHDPTYFSRLEEADPLSWTGDYTLSSAEVSELKAPEWIIPNLVIRGHLIVIAAEPNAGKTTIFTHFSGEMVKQGYRVCYVNSDIAGTDAAHFVQRAERGGWSAMLPDLKTGLSIEGVVDQLTTMNETGVRLDDVVFVFDTLKKMTDVISKSRVKQLLKLLRALTGKGMTIILLAHTNKYKNDDGKPIYEGTGDIRSDADELIYLIPLKNDDGTMTVSTVPDKVRGDFKPITLTISKNREISQELDYVDTVEFRREQDQYTTDLKDIQTILQVLRAGIKVKQEITDLCQKTYGMGTRTSRRILQDYSSGHFQQWTVHKAPKQHANYYTALSDNGG